jgi:hypothetical protein
MKYIFINELCEIFGKAWNHECKLFIGIVNDFKLSTINKTDLQDLFTIWAV